MRKRFGSYKDSGVEWVGEVPSHWDVSKYKYYIDILSGYPFKSTNFNHEHGVPIIRIRDITSGEIETYYDGEFEPDYIVNKGDLLIGMDGDFNLRWWNNEQALLNQRCCSIKESKYVLRRYLFYLLPFQLKTINDLTYYTTVKHLSTRDIYNSPLILAPLPEQSKRPSNCILPCVVTSQIFVLNLKIWKIKERMDSMASLARMRKSAFRKLKSQLPSR